MNESRISVRYAKALFETAQEENSVGQTGQDMKFILAVNDTPEFRSLINNPVIPISRKTAIFHSAFSGQIGPLSLSLANLVIAKGRERYLAQIARNFISMAREHLGITEVTLTTAIEPEPDLREKIAGVISSTFDTKIDLHEVVNPDIIGGFIIRIEDRLFDSSVRNKLRNIAREMT
ncbi:MAG: ATP synthase F1 subunit delta [Bacteroidales bacterium]|nr:ATP synthase F1 subunit delta [Bacteroidales bacterium]